MKVILIQGKANKGKTSLCEKIKEWIETETQIQFNKIDEIKINKKDFLVVYEITFKRSKKRVIINSQSDISSDIDKFEKFYWNNIKNNTLTEVTNIINNSNITNKQDVIKEISTYAKNMTLSDIISNIKNSKLTNKDEVLTEIKNYYYTSNGYDILITAIRTVDNRNSSNLNKQMRSIYGLEYILELDTLPKSTSIRLNKFKLLFESFF